MILLADQALEGPATCPASKLVLWRRRPADADELPGTVRYRFARALEYTPVGLIGHAGEGEVAARRTACTALCDTREARRQALSYALLDINRSYSTIL